MIYIMNSVNYSVIVNARQSK